MIFVYSYIQLFFCIQFVFNSVYKSYFVYKGSTPTKSIAFETIVSGRHITITMSAPVVDCGKYTTIFTKMLGSLKLNGGS